MPPDPQHPHAGVVMSGDDSPKAYYIQIEALPGREEEVVQMLRDIRACVEEEPGTGPLYAVRHSPTRFAIFEAFPSIAGRNVHFAGGQHLPRHQADECDPCASSPCSERHSIRRESLDLNTQSRCHRIGLGTSSGRPAAWPWAMTRPQTLAVSALTESSGSSKRRGTCSVSQASSRWLRRQAGRRSIPWRSSAIVMTLMKPRSSSAEATRCRRSVDVLR